MKSALTVGDESFFGFIVALHCIENWKFGRENCVENLYAKLWWEYIWEYKRKGISNCMKFQPSNITAEQIIVYLPATL